MEIQVYSALPAAKRKLWLDFLSRMGLCCDDDPEQTVLVSENDRLIATGSRQRNVLKYIAVNPVFQGQGLTATVLTQLRQAAFQAGHRHLFLYTKPANEHLFTPLFFYPVARTNQVLLMEDRPNGIQSFLESLPIARTGGTIGAAVMNCDPFTLGHRHLIETAAVQCDRLYVFILSEDAGHFSPQQRMDMVKLGTADLVNVTVLPTDAYLISSATFPTYFLKDRDKAADIQCQLDIEIFTRHFAPHFGITRRYVGTEPLSPMTEGYNRMLEELLPARGISLSKIPRLCREDSPISASQVRRLFDAGQWDALQKLVPDTTFSYLQEVTK